MKSPFTFRPTGRTSAGPVAQSTPGTDHIPRTVQTHVDVCLRARPGPVRPEDVRTKQTGRQQQGQKQSLADAGCRHVDNAEVWAWGKQTQTPPHRGIGTALTFTPHNPPPPPRPAPPSLEKWRKKKTFKKGHICLQPLCSLLLPSAWALMEDRSGTGLHSHLT